MSTAAIDKGDRDSIRKLNFNGPTTCPAVRFWVIAMWGVVNFAKRRNVHVAAAFMVLTDKTLVHVPIPSQSVAHYRKA